jgi:hypothetical protein
MTPYAFTVPAGWQQREMPDGPRLSRTASDGGEVVMQLRGPVGASAAPLDELKRVLAELERDGGLREPDAGQFTTYRDVRPRASIVRSYVDRDGVPVYFFLFAVRDGAATGLLQMESRSAPAWTELRGEVTAIVNSLRVTGPPAGMRTVARLLTAPLPAVAAPSTPPMASSPQLPGSTLASAAAAAWASTAPATWPMPSDGPRLSGVWATVESHFRATITGTAIRRDWSAYVFWPDGRVLMTLPRGGVVRPGQQSFPGLEDSWGRYVVRGDSVTLTWGTAGRASYGLARAPRGELDAAVMRPAAAPVDGLGLVGTWHAVGYDADRVIRFDAAGRFTTGRIGIPETPGQGRYQIRGYSIELRYDGSDVEYASFYSPMAGASPATIFIERIALERVK